MQVWDVCVKTAIACLKYIYAYAGINKGSSKLLSISEGTMQEEGMDSD